MAIDTPAKIAVLGAGPLGLEAALYARFLGYDVVVFERGRVAENVLRHGDVPMSTPFGANRSTLGLAALEAHDTAFTSPGDEKTLTCREWVERYLLPLAQTDLLADHFRLGTDVVVVGKDELPPGDLPEDEDRGDYDFRLLLRNADGQEEIHKTDAVLDATGDGTNFASELQSEPPEPNFYVLGPRLGGGGLTFTYSDGLARIREVFAIIGDRPDLDLYTGAQKLLREAR